MDAEDLAIQRSLPVLRNRRNIVLPIQRLPPEIIAHIFAICAEYTHALWRHQQPSTVGWIAATQLCQQWRQIALSVAGLWTTVTFVLGDRWAEEMYTRSQAASVNVHLVSKVSLDKYELIAKHISRTRQLILGPLQFHPSFFLLSEEHPAPLLETLSIMDMVINPSDAAPLNYLGNCAPALRTLKISTICPDIPWNAALLTQLVSLEVLCGGPVTTCSINDVLTTLERMGQLESLNLSSALPVFIPSGITVHRPVVMPRLKYLTLGGAIASVAPFLEALRTPVCVKLHLALDIEFLDELEIRAFFVRVTAAIQGGSWSATQALRLSTFHHEDMKLWDLRIEAFQCVEGAPYVLRDEMTEEEGDITITLYWDDDAAAPMETDDMARMCYDTFASAQLQLMVIDVGQWGTFQWVAIAGTLAGLKYLLTAGDSAWSFLRNLQWEVSERMSGSLGQDLEDPKWLLPGLLSLAFGGLELNMFGNTLYDWLHARVDADCPLKDLTLLDCISDPAQLEELRAVPGLVLNEDNSD
ncbi:hypothetical protein FA95DRAFT_1525667 [Auriscalpium vulgare]|uniref:Uncharacterized protein n=1 Tax=Auriscalpium vulgare TaxID=40419 RepID=A0ACB8RDF0_9AGAM|nr:hypothetical protein FA95DRAFT_1525667 [Auriscalpium vulgare]